MTVEEAIQNVKRMKKFFNATGDVHDGLALSIQVIEETIVILKEQLNEAKNGGHKDEANK